MIKNAQFVISSPTLEKCPDFLLPEFALVGRSNVGKSTFINTIANNGKLALTSSKPGKTKLINLFNFNQKFIIADLPGYGYSSVSKAMQQQWQINIEKYLLNRKNLASLIQFIDGRHVPQKNDIQMRDWIETNRLNYFVVITKTDYLSKNELNKRILEVEKEFNTRIFKFAKGNSIYAKEIIQELTSEKYAV